MTDRAYEALERIDPPQEIAEATLLIIGCLGVNTERVRAEADFRWIVDDRVAKGLLACEDGHEAVKAYCDYLVSPDGTPQAAPKHLPA